MALEGKKNFRIKRPGAYFWTEKTKAKNVFSENTGVFLENSGTFKVVHITHTHIHIVTKPMGLYTGGYSISCTYNPS